VLAEGAGIGVGKTCALSLLVFTGASQFAAVGVIAGGGSAVAATVGAMLLGARNGLYAVALRPLHRGLPLWRRAVAAQLTIDETAGLAAGQADRRGARLAFWSMGLLLYTCWNVGTLAGALAGSVLPDPRTLGIDAAFPAAFLSLVVALVQSRPACAAALTGAALAVATIPLLPAGLPVLVGALGVLVGLRVAPDGEEPR
jgi:predicted branched-subunit amino acid permease